MRVIGLSRLLWFFILALLALPGRAAVTSVFSLDMENLVPGSLPPGWQADSWGTTGGKYHSEVVRGDAHSGKQCLLITQKGETSRGDFGALAQFLPAGIYRGRTVRFSAWVRFEGERPADSGRLLVRVDRAGQLSGFFNNMGANPVRSHQWQRYEIVAPVATDASALNLAFMLTARGKLWVDDVNLEVIDGPASDLYVALYQAHLLTQDKRLPEAQAAYEATLKRPEAASNASLWQELARITQKTDPAKAYTYQTRGSELQWSTTQGRRVYQLDAEEADRSTPEGWFVPPGVLEAGYAVRRIVAGAQGSGHAYLLERKEKSPEKPGTFGNLLTSIDAVAYRGKKVRFRVWARCEPAREKDAAYPWLRVDLIDGTTGYFDNTSPYEVRLGEWRSYDIVAMVDSDANSITMGTMLNTRGKVELDDLSFEVVDEAPTDGYAVLYAAEVDLHEERTAKAVEKLSALLARPELKKTPNIQIAAQLLLARAQRQNPVRARAACEAALQIQHTLGDREAEANLALTVGQRLQKIDYPGAASAYERARALYLAEGKVNAERFINATLYRLQISSGDFSAALQSLNYLRSLARREKNISWEWDALSALGEFYLAISGNMALAYEYYSQATALARTNNLKVQECMDLFFTSLVHLGAGQPKRAKARLEEMFTLSQSIGFIPYQAMGSAYMGYVTYLEGDKPRGYALVNQGIVLGRQGKDALAEFSGYAVLLGMYQMDGRIKEARATIAILRQLEPKLKTERRFIDLDYTEALLEVQENPQKGVSKVEGLLSRFTTPTQKALVYHKLGEGYLQIKELKKADAALLQAVRSKEEASRRLDDPVLIARQSGGDSAASSFGLASGSLENYNRRQSYLYPLAARVKVLLGDPKAGLELVERGRARGLSAQVDENVLLTQVSTKEAADWKEARAALSFWSGQVRQREQELAMAHTQARQQAMQEDPVAKATKELAEAKTALAEADQKVIVVRGELYRKYPQFKSPSTAGSSSFESLQNLAVAHPDTLYLEYALVDGNTLLLFALHAKTGLKAFVLPVGAIQLTPLVGKWRELLSNAASVSMTVADERKVAQELSTLLLGTMRKNGLLKLPGVTRLAIVADAELQDIPFSALFLDTTGTRLIEKFSLSNPMWLGGLTRASAKRTPTKMMLAIADPFGGRNPTIQPVIRGKLGPLPGARREVSALKVTPVDVRSGEGATEAAIKPVLEDYALLHFATHSVADNAQGLQSYLALLSGDGEDGFLEAQEIIGRHLNAEMVTLSACETAQGQATRGEGQLGLVWAFRAAGVPAVIASQWKVADRSTQVLMTTFYQGLRQGLPKDRALQQAILKVKRAYPHPFFWSAFNVYGDPIPLSLNPQRDRVSRQFFPSAW